MDISTDQVVLFRIAERLTLTFMVLLVAIIVMIGFWRTVQRMELADGNKLGVAGSFAFSTPVFVLLTIVAYAQVSLSNPIAVTPTGSTLPEAQAAAGNGAAFIGASAVEAVSGDPDYARGVAERRVQSLNCLAAGQDLSPRVADDLARVKLDVLAPVWVEDWGDFDAFSGWALRLQTDAPDAQARAVFEKEHVIC